MSDGHATVSVGQHLFLFVNSINIFSAFGFYIGQTPENGIPP